MNYCFHRNIILKNTSESDKNQHRESVTIYFVTIIPRKYFPIYKFNQ